MKDKNDVWQGTLALMVLKTLDAMGPQHGYGIARRIEQISADRLAVNHGTLYPVLLKLEQEGSIAAKWGTSENNRKAKFYIITNSGRKQLESETRHWLETTEIIARFIAARQESS
jgi:PadR family transcriptional regulator PadR